jgi:hypothetical protein
MYANYYLEQAGSGVVFRGTPNQKGHGLGKIFGGLFRAAIPLLKSGAKAVGKQAIHTGIDIARDVSLGKPVKESLKRRFEEGAEGLVNKAKRKIEALQTGEGYKRKRRRLGSSYCGKAALKPTYKEAF